MLYRYSLVLLLLIAGYSQADNHYQKDQVLLFLENIESHGFSVDDKDWVSVVKDNSAANLKRIYSKYSQFLDEGRLNKKLFQSGWAIPDVEGRFVDSARLVPIEKIQSQIPEYKILKQALSQLKWWQANALKVFHDRVILFEDDEGDLVARLNDWLLDIDLMREGLASTYSKEHMALLTEVQLDHKLLPDGRFGSSTRQALLSITNKRIKTLKANLERLRWLPQKLQAPYVWLDIPGFKVSWMGADGDIYHHRAIVGKPNSQTPILKDEIDSISINPVWKVPHRIAAYRLLKNEQRSPGILKKEGFVVYENWDDRAKAIEISEIQWGKYSPRTFRFRLEQQPGAMNRLGKYKFNMLNEYGIYLHDTNDPTLFDHRQRMLSSGCARIDNVKDFVSYVLSLQGDEDSLMLASDVSAKISLNKPVDVYLIYFTAWPDGDGRVRFREDIYNLDASLVSWF